MGHAWEESDPRCPSLHPLEPSADHSRAVYNTHREISLQIILSSCIKIISKGLLSGLDNTPHKVRIQNFILPGEDLELYMASWCTRVLYSMIWDTSVLNPLSIYCSKHVMFIILLCLQYNFSITGRMQCLSKCIQCLYNNHHSENLMGRCTTHSTP